MEIVELPVRIFPPDLIARFAAIVGDRYAITAPSEIAPYLSEERGLYHGRSPLVLRPGSCFLSSLVPKEAVPSEATAPPLPAVRAHSPMGSRASWCSGSKLCSPTAASSTICAN